MFCKSKFHDRTHGSKPLVNRVAGLQTCNSITKGLWYKCFSVEFLKFLKPPILRNICKRLLVKPVYSLGLLFLTTLVHFWLKLVPILWFFHHHLQFGDYAFTVLAQTFPCEFWEISHNTFSKELLERLLLPKHLFYLLFCRNLSHFQKRFHMYFPGEYFLDLICRLGARVSSVFHILSQKLGAYVQPSQASLMELFCENIKKFKIVKYFWQEASL